MGKLRSAWKRWREARTKGSAIRPFRPCMKSLYMYHPPSSPEELEYVRNLIEEYKKREGLTGS